MASSRRSQIQELQSLSLDAIPWWTLKLRRRETIHVPRVAELPDEAAGEREILEAQQVRSVLAMPMIHEHTVIGFLGFDSVREEKAWAEDDIALLRLVGEMFVGALERSRMHELEEELVHARSLENVARLAGGVAHDFNNLLAIILNCAALLRRKVVDPEPSSLIDDIFESAKRASELTRQLLQVAHRDVTAPVVLDVNAVIRALEPILQRTMGERIEIEVDLAPDPTLVRVGLPQLEQVLVNLALNARDAMRDGGTLAIRTAAVDIDDRQALRFIDVSPGRHVLLTVRDDGAGMDPGVASRAFEPFFTTKGGAGTGLGLATVYGMVKQAGGHVALESEPGNGTTAKIYLPAAPGAAPIVAARVTRDEETPDGRGELVLVVEDSPKLRALVRTVLIERGYLVLEASDPTDALRVLGEREGEVTLLLTDVILPQMSGRELAMRARERHGIARVLYMSGYDDDVVAHHGVLEDGVHFLAKPFLEADLLREVRRAIDDAGDGS
ncbi:MAG: ATP-binding protein [Myxococcota bacterium]|nr:ATP-binding protein [Myxococcota bacterium]